MVLAPSENPSTSLAPPSLGVSFCCFLNLAKRASHSSSFPSSSAPALHLPPLHPLPPHRLPQTRTPHPRHYSSLHPRRAPRKSHRQALAVNKGVRLEHLPKMRVHVRLEPRERVRDGLLCIVRLGSVNSGWRAAPQAEDAAKCPHALCPCPSLWTGKGLRS
jgi:hypothetical protein